MATEEKKEVVFAPHPLSAYPPPRHAAALQRSFPYPVRDLPE